jgi:hypothetical protein
VELGGIKYLWKELMIGAPESVDRRSVALLREKIFWLTCKLVQTREINGLRGDKSEKSSGLERDGSVKSRSTGSRCA